MSNKVRHTKLVQKARKMIKMVDTIKYDRAWKINATLYETFGV